MHTPNTRHSGSEPMPLQGPITRASARQFNLSSWTQKTILRSVGCMLGSDVHFNGTRRSRNFHTGTEGFQMHTETG